MKKILVAAVIGGMWVSGNAASFRSLSDAELAKVDGQALLNFSRDAYSYTTSNSESVSFFKLSLDAEMELNTNIKSLQLGCGGVNGAGKCDIDIANLALSGLPSRYDSNGVPVYDNGRASTSAKITNPFIEFAVKNGGQASTREIVGFRLGAAEILGMLTAGTENSRDPSDGIQSFSGYMKMAATQGDVNTKASKFGVTESQEIEGNLHALGQDRVFRSDHTNASNTGITVPSINVKFNMPETVVTGKRMTQAKVAGISANIPAIPLAAGENASQAEIDRFKNDQLYVGFDPILGIAKSSLFKMGTGSKISQLNMDISFTQALSMIHNLPLTGTGGYLSLQSEAVKWSGTDREDIAQTGWWMSLKDPVQLGYLQAQEEVDISAVLPQVADLVTAFMKTPEQEVNVGTWEALGSLFNVPVVRTLNIDLATATTANPASISLNSQILKNQQVVSNCFGGLKFC